MKKKTTKDITETFPTKYLINSGGRLNGYYFLR